MAQNGLAASITHASRHATGGLDAVTPSAIAAQSAYTISVITATATVAPWGWYRINPDTNATSIPMTLVSAPPNGTEVVFENLGATYTVTFVRGGTDTIEGNTTAYTLNPNEFVILTYQSSGTQWFMRRFLASPTPGTTMRRDPNGRAQVATPAASNDIANKTYVDTSVATIDGGTSI